MTGTSGRRLAALACATALLTGGCGVPTGGPVTTVSPSAVPYGLGDPRYGQESTPEPSSSTRTQGGSVLYFIDASDRLLAVPLPSGQPRGERALEAALGALVTGPEAGERARGLRTAFSPGTRLTVRSQRNGIARIEVTVGGRPPGPDALPLAVGQIVLTATSLPDVLGVLLVDGGQPLPTPLPGGGLVNRAVTARDYAGLVR